jgi:hypothetical protein
MRLIYSVIFVCSIFASDVSNSIFLWNISETYFLDLTAESGNDSETSDSNESEKKVEFFLDDMASHFDCVEQSTIIVVFDHRLFFSNYQEIVNPPPDLG